MMFGFANRLLPGIALLLLPCVGIFWADNLCADLTAADNAALSQRQAGVAERYQRLEELLLRLADMETAENPERTALLRRAARQSRDKFVLQKLRTATESLRTEEFQKAVENQESANEELAALLTLLMSEDRSKRIRDEKERYRKLIKDLKRNLNNQRSARARTENDADLEDVQQEQKSVTERSEELKDRLSEENQSERTESESTESESTESESTESESTEQQQQSEQSSNEQSADSDKPPAQPPSEQPPSEQPPSEQPPSGQEPSGQEPSTPQPGDQQPSDQQQPSEPSPADPNQQQSSQPPSSGPQQPSQPQSPEQEVEQRLQRAIENMQQAEQELEQAQRQNATENQRQAEENLRAAIDRLEQILRQLREEEMQRELAKLESRLRKMAAMQTKVLDDTIAVAATPQAQRNRQTDLKSGDLAFEEKKVTLEADRAMLLLREEGSSVAFPEVIDQIRDDTVRVADRLSQTKIDAVTQGIQQDILAALEEMIAALQQAQRDLEEQRQQQQQGQPQQPGPQEQPLVQALAELKLIRTMETRIKKTTDRYSGLLESGESTSGDLLPLLQSLAERQNRLYRITRDLVLKRNN